MAPHQRMLAALLVGAGTGVLARAALPAQVLRVLVDYVAQPLGQIFLRLLFVLVVPLLFSALVVGVAEVDLERLKVLGKRTLGYTVCVSFVSVVVGLALVNLLGPGRGSSAELLSAAHGAVLPPSAKAPVDLSPVSILVGMIPTNAVSAAAEGDMLGLIVFSLLFGIALAVTKTAGSEQLLRAISGIYDVSMTWIDAVLRKVAPFGVGALLFAMTTRIGAGVLLNLAAYVAVVVVGLGIQLFGVYSLSVRFLGGRSPREFFRGSRAAIVTAFSTASSNATLPTAISVAERELKLPSHVARFVLTAGSAMNQNGTALYEGVTVLFLAQVAGVELSLEKQLLVMLICVLAGIGTAGVPAGSLPVIAMILSMVGVPPEGLG
ncbi:MAG TPA: dicarboxylate/amino acid:cation symporter, partial [Polyangiaceae bacterium]|nr:dicarboxylate/amino acid:cation symporter [Polyangiaceae bacterium]